MLSHSAGGRESLSEHGPSRRLRVSRRRTTSGARLPPARHAGATSCASTSGQTLRRLLRRLRRRPSQRAYAQPLGAAHAVGASGGGQVAMRRSRSRRIAAAGAARFARAVGGTVTVASAAEHLRRPHLNATLAVSVAAAAHSGTRVGHASRLCEFGPRIDAPATPVRAFASPAPGWAGRAAGAGSANRARRPDLLRTTRRRPSSCSGRAFASSAPFSCPSAVNADLSRQPHH